MKDLIKLISIANRLDQKGLTKEADQVDGLIRSLAQTLPHDSDDKELNKWLKADEITEEDEELGMFGGDGPSEAELMAMESGVDIFAGEDLALLEEQMKALTKEMEIFTGSLINGELTSEDFSTFDHIKKQFAEVGRLLEEAKSDKDSLGFEA